MKKAFTLIEVTLAMAVMAGGIISVIGLYSLGFRESSQSSEDVAAAALADAVIGPLVMALGATDLKWSTFKNLQSYPSDDGWGAYIDQDSGKVKGDPTGVAQSAFGKVMSKLGVSVAFPSVPSGFKCALVVLHEHEDGKESAVVRIGFRAMKNEKQLMAMPLYYTEVRFQGQAD